MLPPRTAPPPPAPRPDPKTPRMTRFPRPLRLFLLFALFPVCVLLTAGAGAPAFGQEDAPAAAPAADAAAPATAAPASQNFLVWMLEANGYFFGFVFLALSFVTVALITLNVLQVRRENFLPDGFVEDFEAELAAKEYQNAYELAKEDESVVARVLAAGLGRLNRGYPEAVEAMQEVGEDENMTYEHRLSYLALLGAIAPMLGLLGTVSGMISSFQTIAQSTTAPKPAELAQGISQALFTTLEGLAIAIPAMVAYSLLRNRVARHILEVGIVSEGLMQRFSALGKAAKKEA